MEKRFEIVPLFTSIDLQEDSTIKVLLPWGVQSDIIKFTQ